jgi:hypothetical protein
MSDRDSDPIASTQMFRAFVRSQDARQDAQPTSRRWPVLVTLTVLLAVAAAVAVAWLVAG